ncbi:MAG: lysophospholipid acyltransferase family protein [Planctomycetaceae bacterium]|nr:lysophospholipid acyltransferase family protein [Planctomycetaceae bacterium]
MKINSPILIKLGAFAIFSTMWMLFRTLRLSFQEDQAGTNPYSKETTDCFFYSVWHDALIIPTFAGKHRRAAALTSQHTDGSIIAQILRLVGMSTVRGSTNRISPSAIRQLLKTVENKHLVITPDGPRGPRREMSIGIIYLASRTGRAIIPTAYACTRCWRVKGSWTDQLIPKPFSKVFLLTGKPVEVPQGIKMDQLEEYRSIVQQEMDRLNTTAENLASGKKAD